MTPHSCRECSSAIRLEYTTNDTTNGLERRREFRRERYLSDEQTKWILAALHKLKETDLVKVAAARLLYFTGVRPKEVEEAKYADFEFDEGYWTKPAGITKTGNVHRVKLTKTVFAMLCRLQWTTGNGLRLFPASYSAEGHVMRLSKCWRDQIIPAAELKDALLYTVRKTFAARLISQGVNFHTLMSLSGHVNVNKLLR